MLNRLPRLLTRAAFLKAALLVISVTAITLTALAAQSAPSQSITISGKVSGASGRHSVYIALWDESGFLQKPVQQVLIKPGTEPAFQFRVPAGAWSISAYEDTNENGKLDMGIFGPKEPSGFYRPFHQWHKPRFNEVSFRADRDTPGIDIALRH
jgi:uncharacterized protein (DUF2141 family)